MINPQKEKGHIKIATGKPWNDVFGALAKSNLSGKEYQVIFWIIRKTWGFNKKEDWISLSQFVKDLGIDQAYLCRIIKKLTALKIIIVRKIPGKTFYSFNKIFTDWLVVSTPVAYSLTSSGVQSNQVVEYSPHTKSNITKAILQKEKKCTECNGTQKVKVGRISIRCPLCRET